MPSCDAKKTEPEKLKKYWEKKDNLGKVYVITQMWLKNAKAISKRKRKRSMQATVKIQTPNDENQSFNSSHVPGITHCLPSSNY